MQAQEVSPLAAPTGLGTEQGIAGAEEHGDHGDHGHKKKSVIGKVKDKAKKLKTKIKKPKSPGATGDNNDHGNQSSSPSSSEDESGDSEPQQQNLGENLGGEKDVIVTPGLKGAAYEAVPDPHANVLSEQPHVDASGVQDRFGQLRLGDEPEKMQEEVPSAPGQISAGVTPSLASKFGESEFSRGIPVEEGKNSEGKDLLVTPASESDDKLFAPMDLDQPSDVSKTSENKGAWYTPTSEGEQQKPLTDRAVEGATAAKDKVAATAVSGAAALGLKSDPASTENVEDRGTDVGGTRPKSMLEQAKEKIWGSTKKPEDEPLEVGQNKPTVTGRAAETVTGLKDTIASKLGYGSNKNLTTESDLPAMTIADTPSATAPVDSQNPENKQTITGRAAGTVTGLKDTIASKLGYGSNKNLTSETSSPSATTTTDTSISDAPVDSPNPDNKSALQKLQETAAGATGVITSKLGYGGKQSPSEQSTVGEQAINPGEKYTETAIDEMNPGESKPFTQTATEAVYGAKDAVASKLGYGSTSPTDRAVSGTPGDNKSYLQKMQETAAGVKDTAVSKLGYANRDLPEGASERAYGNEQNLPASTAARFHPGEEDKALSQLITEKMSTGAATVKDTLFKPFGASKSGPPTPTTTPPPSAAEAVIADPERTTVRELTATTPDVPAEEKPGIMGKVTGAVSSLLGTTGSGKKKVDETAGKANEDPQVTDIPSQ